RLAPGPAQIAVPASVPAQPVASEFAAAPKQPGVPVQTAVIAAERQHDLAQPAVRLAQLPALPALRPGALAPPVRVALSGVARPGGLHRPGPIQIQPATALAVCGPVRVAVPLLSALPAFSAA